MGGTPPKGVKMKIHAVLTIEKDYNYNEKDWELYYPNLTKEQFKKEQGRLITEDFERIVNRAGNVIGEFNYNIQLGEKENEQ